MVSRTSRYKQGFFLVITSWVFIVIGCQPVKTPTQGAPESHEPTTGAAQADSPGISATVARETTPANPNTATSGDGRILYYEAANVGGISVINSDGNGKIEILNQENRSEDQVYSVDCSLRSSVCIVPRSDGFFSFNYSTNEWKFLTACNDWCNRDSTFFISPDGEKFVFMPNNGQYYIMNTDSSGDKQYISGGNENPEEPLVEKQSVSLLYDFDPTPVKWSPDSKKVAYKAYDKSSANSSLNIYDVNNSTSQEIMTEESLQKDSYGWFYFSPSWSPDGKQIAFNRNSGGIYIVKEESSKPTLLVDDGEEASWSPDGTKIMFSETVFLDAEPDYFMKYYIINTDGTGVTELPEGHGLNQGDAGWSPDGSEILLFRDENIGDEENPLHIWLLYKIDSDGTGEKALTTTSETCLHADWSLDGHRILIVTKPFSAGECSQNLLGCLYVMNEDGSNRTRITDENDPILSAKWIP